MSCSSAGGEAQEPRKRSFPPRCAQLTQASSPVLTKTKTMVFSKSALLILVPVILRFQMNINCL